MILVGKNSSGKSSLLKQFPLLKQSIGVRRNGIFLWHDPNGIDLGNFSNALKTGEDEMAVEYGIDSLKLKNRYIAHSGRTRVIENVRLQLVLRNKDEEYEYLKKIAISFSSQKIEIEIGNDGIVGRILINGYKVNSSNEKIISSLSNSLLPRLAYVYHNHFDNEGSHVCNEIIRALKLKDNVCKDSPDSSYQSRMKIRMLLDSDFNTPDFIEKKLSKRIVHPDTEYGLNELFIWYRLNSIIDALNFYFLDLADTISYIQPIRAYARRYYRIDNIASDEINSDGTNLAMFLYNLPDHYLKDFQKWTRKHFKFRVLLKPSEGHVQLRIQFSDSKIARNLADIGFGYSQILPILATIWKTLKDLDSENKLYVGKDPNSPRHFIVIEQPELHLHPAFISEFATKLVSLIKELKKDCHKLSIIIETHSAALINGIGKQISNTRGFDTDDISVLIFNHKHNSEIEDENADDNAVAPYITEATFDSTGYLQNWPYGFLAD